MCLHYLSCVTTIRLLSLPLALNSITTDASVQAQTTDATNRVSIKDRKAETDLLFQQGVEQFRSGALQSALQTYQQGEYSKALALHYSALKIAEQIGKRAIASLSEMWKPGHCPM